MSDHDRRSCDRRGRFDGNGSFELNFVRPGRHRLRTVEPKKHLPAIEIVASLVDVKDADTTDVGDVEISAEERTQ